MFNSNGTIALAARTNDRGVYMHHCVAVIPASRNNGLHGAVGLTDCVGRTAVDPRNHLSQVPSDHNSCAANMPVFASM